MCACEYMFVLPSQVLWFAKKKKEKKDTPIIYAFSPLKQRAFNEGLNQNGGK